MKRIIAAHVSTAGGIAKAAERAAGIGCNGMQIFTGSPRMWKSSPADGYDLTGYAQSLKAQGIEYVVIHATYLINLASDSAELVAKSREALINDLAICAKGNMAGVVVHLGSHQGRGFPAMKPQLVSELQRILLETPAASVLLIENSAGQNGKIGSQLEEIRELLDEVGNPRLGWCFDTCHAHAAGYSLGAKANALQVAKIRPGGQTGLFETEEKSKVAVEEIERLGLWEALQCVHVNGSRDSCGSCRDRHANLGEGEIADTDMAAFVHHAKVKGLPLVLEVPGLEHKGPDKENVRRLTILLGR